eukprot:g6250.t1
MSFTNLRVFSSVPICRTNRHTRHTSFQITSPVTPFFQRSFHHRPASLRGLYSSSSTEDENSNIIHQHQLCKAQYSSRRVLLKISGEALQGNQGFGIDPVILGSIASEISASHREGIQIAVVIGGGNFFRGAEAFTGIDRAAADNVGMLATIMNAICLQACLENLEVPTRLQTAIEIKEVAEPFIRRRAIRHLEKGRVVIFGGGTGNPFFTTDMAAALRAAEINAQELLKATKVKGIYTSDPFSCQNAELLDHLTYDRALHDHLKVMDHTAISLCRDQCIPIRVFSLYEEGNIYNAILGEDVGSVIRCEEDLMKNRNELPKHFCKTRNSVVSE